MREQPLKLSLGFPLAESIVMPEGAVASPAAIKILNEVTNASFQDRAPH